VAVSVVFAAWSLSQAGSVRRIGWVWTAALITAIGAALPDTPDTAAFAVSALLLLVRRHGARGTWHGTIAAALLAMAAAGLGIGKFTWLMCAAGVVVIVTADDALVRRPRAVPWIAALYVLATVAFWVLAGQPVAALGSFLANSWRVAQGYSEAMDLGAAGEVYECALYVGGVLSLLALVAMGYRQEDRWFARMAPTIIGLVMLSWMAMKAGFVRHDNHALLAAWLLVSIVVMAGLIPHPSLGRRGWGMAYCLPLGLAIWLALLAQDSYGPQKLARFLSPARIGRAMARRVTAALETIDGTAIRVNRQRYATAMDSLRAIGMPPMSGTVDMYALVQGLALSHNLNFSPRPVFQAYSAYTPELAAMNAARLESDEAPQWILMRVESIDQRFPALDDGLSWPLLWTRYRVAHRMNSGLYLERCPPRHYWKTPIAELSTKFGVATDLPETAQGLVWARIKIERTAMHRAANLLYRPPIVGVVVELADGRRTTCRLVLATAEGGFLLSPFVASTGDFGLIADQGERVARSGGRLASQRIARLALVTETDHPDWFFGPEIHIELSALHFTPPPRRVATTSASAPSTQEAAR
jgi:hypothetical protein